MPVAPPIADTVVRWSAAGNRCTYYVGLVAVAGGVTSYPSAPMSTGVPAGTTGYPHVHRNRASSIRRRSGWAHPIAGQLRGPIRHCRAPRPPSRCRPSTRRILRLRVSIARTADPPPVRLTPSYYDRLRVRARSRDSLMAWLCSVSQMQATASGKLDECRAEQRLPAFAAAVAGDDVEPRVHHQQGEAVADANGGNHRAATPPGRDGHGREHEGG